MKKLIGGLFLFGSFLSLASAQTVNVSCEGKYEIKGAYSCDYLLASGKLHLDQYGDPYGSSAGFSKKINVSFSKDIALKRYVSDDWYVGEVKVALDPKQKEEFKQETLRLMGPQGKREICSFKFLDDHYKTVIELDFDKKTNKIKRTLIDGNTEFQKMNGSAIYFLGYSENRGMAHCKVKVLK